MFALSKPEDVVEIDLLNVPPPQEQPTEMQPLVERPQEMAARAEIDPNRPRLIDSPEVRPENPSAPTNVEPIPIVEAAPTATPSAGPEEWTTPPSGPPSNGLGLPGIGTPIWSVPGVIAAGDKPKPAPTTIGPPPAVDRNIGGKVISDIMREKDHGLGLDLPGAGAIASVVTDVVRSSNTPDTAHAVLEVRIAPSGQVASVRVVSSSAGASGDWSAVAASVKNSLASKQFALPTAYAKGAIVTIDVVSKLQLPDGSPAGSSVRRGGPPADSVGTSMTFDVSNIGARPKRHVRSLPSARPAT